MNKIFIFVAILLGIAAGIFIFSYPSVTRSLVLALQSKPVEISIPKLDISAQVEYVGKNSEGAMGVPKNVNNVAWYKLGPRPGETGNAVIAGHLDSDTGPAVFAKLPNLKTGDEFEVISEEGERKTFVVEKTKVFPDDQFPITEVFGPSDERRLNLITCVGQFNREENEYSDRYVVYSVLKE